MGRELDDAILSLRTNELEIGTWLLRTQGDPRAVLDVDRALCEQRNHWFVRETIGLLRRALARLEVSSRTLFALIDRGSCFAGTLLELALAADRTYMRASTDRAAPCVAVGAVNFGFYPPVAGPSRLENRHYGAAGTGRRAPRRRWHAPRRGAGARPRARHVGARRHRLGRTRSGSRSRSARRCHPTR